MGSGGAGGAGTSVTYQADLHLNGPLGRLLDPLLGLGFRRVGDRAAVAGEQINHLPGRSVMGLSGGVGSS